MQIIKATEKDKEESIKIATNLKDWFNKDGLKNMKIDFELNNLVVAKDNEIMAKFQGFCVTLLILARCC